MAEGVNRDEVQKDLDLIDECLDLYSERISHSGNAESDEREGCCFGHDTLIDAREALERIQARLLGGATERSG